MKLRCTHNSIRIRIKKSELKQLAVDRKVEEKIHFNVQTALTFALIIVEELDQVKADFINNHLIVAVPIATAREWMNSNQVGIEVNNPITKDQQLHILIEKDFPCLDRPNEDKSDTFWELASDDPKAC